MYSIPYIIVALVLFFLYGCECGKIKCGITAKQARTIAFLLLLFFLGLRGHIKSDFISYYPFFEDLPNIFELNFSNIKDFQWEPGFIIYSSLVKTIIPNYFGWVFINTLIDLLVFRYVFKNYTHSQILPFLFFIAFNGLLIEFNLYRNIKAIDLFLLSLPYLQQRRVLPYMILNLLGVSFHVSSLTYIPLYWVLCRRIPKVVLWSGIIVANIVFLGHISVISDFLNNLGVFQAMDFYEALSGYVENSDNAKLLSIGYLERTFAVVTFMLLYNRLERQQEYNVIFCNCFWLYYISFLFFYEVSVLVDRIPTLFIFSYWVLYPNVFTTKFRIRPIVVAITMLLVFLKIYTGNNEITSKYENILFIEDNYEERKQIQIDYFNHAN